MFSYYFLGRRERSLLEDMDRGDNLSPSYRLTVKK